MTAQDNGPATQVYRIFIGATPERVWDAITSPDLSPQWFFGSIVTMGYRFVGRGPDGELRVDGVVLSSTPPHRLEHEWSSMRKEHWAAEPTSRVTWEIEPADPDVSLLTLTHDRLVDRRTRPRTPRRMDDRPERTQDPPRDRYAALPGVHAAEVAWAPATRRSAFAFGCLAVKSVERTSTL